MVAGVCPPLRGGTRGHEKFPDRTGLEEPPRVPNPLRRVPAARSEADRPFDLLNIAARRSCLGSTQCCARGAEPAAFPGPPEELEAEHG